MNFEDTIIGIGCLGAIFFAAIKLLLPFAIIATIIWGILHFENRAANPPLNETKTEQKGN